eukprot:CAMPEP_0182878444 /NCGR_PEP_ID=MMETSP0034_2-20130328/15358_1 /TAXON_ID=156128 /ORGANISM="Nephroselmis pyriformis, Strain CCMP717" /LENGTH=125 /DNA_ID=CAMNT_0025011329 /DNA_START=178 /DNA_END=555 /DNA_ORIENTATION=+
MGFPVHAPENSLRLLVVIFGLLEAPRGELQNVASDAEKGVSHGALVVGGRKDRDRAGQLAHRYSRRILSLGRGMVAVPSRSRAPHPCGGAEQPRDERVGASARGLRVHQPRLDVAPRFLESVGKS